LKDTEFYRESKAFFIHISSIASFKPFLIVWWWEYCTFSDSSVVSFKSSPWPKYTQYGTIFQKNHVLLSNFFSYSNMLSIRLFLANTRKKKIGGYRACFLTNCCEMWSWIRRSLSGWRIGAVGTGTRHKMALMLRSEKVAQCKTRESP